MTPTVSKKGRHCSFAVPATGGQAFWRSLSDSRQASINAIPSRLNLANLPRVGIGHESPIKSRQDGEPLRQSRSLLLSALSDRLSSLPTEHRIALEWFSNRRGDLIGWPEPLDGLFLVNRPKGIHKPRGWIYALSVRQSLVGPYADRPPVEAADGSWTYEYFQEGQNAADRDLYATNRGLMACKDDKVPVAVLIQEKGKPAVQYRVQGLAKVVDWVDGHFKLLGYDLAGNLPDGALNERDFAYGISAPVYGGMAEPSLPIDVMDARKRIDAQIVVRQGGKAFRSNALKNFGGRCAISGWKVEAVLEAAHLVPYRGPQTDQPDNAILLRADLHTLFDRELLHIDPETRRVILTPALRGGPYDAFEGQEVHLATGVTAKTFRDRLNERSEQLKSKTS